MTNTMISTEDPDQLSAGTSDRPKPFKSKLFKLPPELLDGVDALADEGRSADYVRRWLQENNAPPHLVPNRKTIATYLGHRRERSIAIVDEGRQLVTDVRSTDLSGVDPGNRAELRRRSIATIISRIELLKRVQQTEGMDPRWERTMVDQLDLLRKLLDTEDEACSGHESLSGLT